MFTVRRIQPTSKGVLAGLLFGAAWGTLAVSALLLFAPAKVVGHAAHAWSTTCKLRVGGEWGGAAGAGLFLLHQTFFAALFVRPLARRLKFTWPILVPVTIAYYLLSWPGVLVARAFHFVELGPKEASHGHAGAPHALGDKCPFEGSVVSSGDCEFLHIEWTRGETIIEIHEDGRVSTEKVRYFGWIDDKGDIREGTGDIDRTAHREVLASIRDGGMYLGNKKIGEFQAA